MTELDLSAFSLFKALDTSALEDIKQQLCYRTYNKNQYIISIAQPETNVYFVLSGAVRVCAFSTEGKQVLFEDLNTGTMFGEMAAFDGKGRSSDCIALQKSEVASISGEYFRQMIRTHPSVAEAVITRLVQLVRRQMERVFEYSTATVGQRLRLELLRLASSHAEKNGPIEIRETLTHADLAARIGTHREAVTRELKALESQGVIRWQRNAHVILDPLALTKS